jgi:hypothetical protein
MNLSFYPRACSSNKKMNANTSTIINCENGCRLQSGRFSSCPKERNVESKKDKAARMRSVIALSKRQLNFEDTQANEEPPIKKTRSMVSVGYELSTEKNNNINNKIICSLVCFYFYEMLLVI